MSPMKPASRTTSLRLVALAILTSLPTCDALADIYGPTTTLTSFFEITNRMIEPKPSFSVSGAGLVSATDISNGLYRVEDNFEPAKFSSLGEYPNYRLGLKLRDSIINIRMVGQKLGHSFTVQGRYLSAKVTASNIMYMVKDGNVTTLIEGEYNGGDCVASKPGQYDDVYSFEIIANSNDISRRCRGSTTGIYYYVARPGTTPTVFGNYRVILLDIGGLQRNPDYRKAPPDIYKGSSLSDMSSSFSLERWEQPQAYYMRYRNEMTIQKNPYFEGVTLPAGDNIFDVKKVNGRIKGNLTIPYVMNGQFTPYNKIDLNVTSTNGFKLKNTMGKDEIPYSLSTTIGVRKLNIANNGTILNGGAALIFTDLSKEFYAIQGRFDADFSANSTIPTGDYTDTVTAVYTISL